MQTAKLQGMTAVVTGGGGSIGAASALRLLQDGAAVLLMGRSLSTLEETRRRLLKVEPEGRIELFAGDAGEDDQVQAALAAAHAIQDRLDMVVATVGGGTYRPVLLHDAASFREILEINIIPSFLAIRHAAPLMTSGGSIVCISSSAACNVTPWMTAYMSAKAGVEHLVRGAAEELGPFGIRVNAVRPGLTLTDRPGSTSHETLVVQAMLVETPLGRIGKPSDTAEAVRYLAGPESSWVTGVMLSVDGGANLRKNPDNLDVVTQVFGTEAASGLRP